MTSLGHQQEAPALTVLTDWVGQGAWMLATDVVVDALRL